MARKPGCYSYIYSPSLVWDPDPSRGRDARVTASEALRRAATAVHSRGRCSTPAPSIRRPGRTAPADQSRSARRRRSSTKPSSRPQSSSSRPPRRSCPRSSLSNLVNRNSAVRARRAQYPPSPLSHPIPGRLVYKSVYMRCFGGVLVTVIARRGTARPDGLMTGREGLSTSACSASRPGSAFRP
jgi:hypothetical protein